MLKIMKENYVNICIAVVYTVVADLVYGIWSYTAWQKWYWTMIIVLAITMVGCVISFFWIKGEITKKQGKVTEPVKIEQNSEESSKDVQ